MCMLHFVRLAWSAALNEENTSFLEQFTGSLIQGWRYSKLFEIDSVSLILFSVMGALRGADLTDENDEHWQYRLYSWLSISKLTWTITLGFSWSNCLYDTNQIELALQCNFVFHQENLYFLTFYNSAFCLI